MAAASDIDGILDCLQGLFSNKDGLRRVLETVLNLGMREEVSAYLGADPHARNDGRRGYRNGAKPR